MKQASRPDDTGRLAPYYAINRKPGYMTDHRSTEIVFDRANASMSVYLANGCWHIKYELHDEPEPIVVWNPMLHASEEQPRSRTTTLQVNLSQLLAALSPDESWTLVGFCQHMIDQGGSHVGYLHQALGEAIGRKDWGATQVLCEELYSTTLVFEQAAATATSILQTGDVHA